MTNSSNLNNGGTSKTNTSKEEGTVMTATLEAPVVTLEDLTLAGETFKEYQEAPYILVSDYGRVWNSKTKRFIHYLGTAGTSRGIPAKNRYMRVGIGTQCLYVHILVLETFVGPRPAGHDADHINHRCEDARLTNLRWLPRNLNRSRAYQKKAGA